MNMINLISEFTEQIKNKNVEIYNEASIQYELAMFLRIKIRGYKIQLERNVDFFGINKKETIKKEIDIVVYNQNEKAAIEIKYPTNGQVPEQMFSFIKDIRFLEQLRKHGFSHNVFLAFVDDDKFWRGEFKPKSIYEYFRSDKGICGQIHKPTGKKDELVTLENEYVIRWNNAHTNHKYIAIEI